MKTFLCVVMVGASVMCWGKNKPDGQDLRQQLQTAEGRCIRWAERIEKDAAVLGVAVPDAVGEARKGLEEYRRAPEWIGLRSRTSKTAAAAAGKLDERLTGVQELLELAEDEIEQEARRRRLAAAAAEEADYRAAEAEDRAKKAEREAAAARSEAGAAMSRKRADENRAAGEKWLKGQ